MDIVWHEGVVADAAPRHTIQDDALYLKVWGLHRFSAGFPPGSVPSLLVEVLKVEGIDKIAKDGQPLIIRALCRGWLQRSPF